MLVSERARGRWREILPLLGVAVKFLTNRHGPCPLCGGKDRFRWDDKDGSGTYFCNQCGAGNGWTMLRKLHGWDNPTVAEEIEKIVGTETPKTQYVQQPQSDDSRRMDALRRLLDEATEPSVVSAYLERRGIQDPPVGLLGHPECPYWNDDTGKIIGRFPAVLAPILSIDGKLVSVQRIYDADIKPRKKTMPPVGTINGATVQLYPVDDELGVAEGVETAIGATLQFGVPTWAAISAHGIEVFQPPAEIAKIHIFGDNDANYEGQAAAFVLARRLSREVRAKKRAPLEIRVNIPEAEATDWLDVYVESRT